MKQFIVLTAIIIFSASSSFAQNKQGLLRMKNGFWGWQFYKNDEKIKMGEVQDLLQSNPEALSKFKAAKTNSIVSTIIGSIGGFMFGYTLGQATAGVDADWTVGGIGGGLIVVSIPIGISANRKAKKAIEMYNDGLTTTSLRRTEVYFGATQNGMGIRLQF